MKTKKSPVKKPVRKGGPMSAEMLRTRPSGDYGIGDWEGPGWYLVDEDGIVSGPYRSQQEAENNYPKGLTMNRTTRKHPVKNTTRLNGKTQAKKPVRTKTLAVKGLMGQEIKVGQKVELFNSDYPGGVAAKIIQVLGATRVMVEVTDGPDAGETVVVLTSYLRAKGLTGYKQTEEEPIEQPEAFAGEETPEEEDLEQGKDPKDALPSAVMLANAYNHLKALADYIDQENPKHEQSDIKAYFDEHKEELNQHLEKYKEMLGAHHDGFDMDKMCKALNGEVDEEEVITKQDEDDDEFPQEEVQNQLEDEEEDEVLKDEEEATDEDFMPAEGETEGNGELPEEEVEAQLEDEVPVEDEEEKQEPGDEDKTTDEILERYRQPKGGRRVGQKAAKKGKSPVGTPSFELALAQKLAAQLSAQPGGKVGVREWKAGRPPFTVFDEGNKFSVNGSDMGNIGLFADRKSAQFFADAANKIKPGKSLSKSHHGVIKEAGDHMGDLAEAPDLAKRHKAGLRWHSKALGDLCKQLDDLEEEVEEKQEQIDEMVEEKAVSQCPGCGADLSAAPEAKFCPGCGTSLAENKEFGEEGLVDATKAEAPMDEEDLIEKAGTCECSDPGCPVCHGHCSKPATETLHRIDTEDRTGTPMCAGCAEDAHQSGVFKQADEDPMEEKQDEGKGKWDGNWSGVKVFWGSSNGKSGYFVEWNGKVIGGPFTSEDDARHALATGKIGKGNKNGVAKHLPAAIVDRFAQIEQTFFRMTGQKL